MEITSSRLHADTGAVLDKVLSGQTITITRYGRAIARLVPIPPDEPPATESTDQN
jgi:prevent-host-death family protein